MADSDEEWKEFNNLGKKKAPITASTTKLTLKPSTVTTGIAPSNPKPQTQPSGTIIKPKPKFKSGDEDSWDMEEQDQAQGAKVSTLDYDAVISGAGSKSTKM